MQHDRRRKLEAVRRVRPDRKGRITLGAMARGVSSFVIRIDPAGALVLEPYREVPAGDRFHPEHVLTRRLRMQDIKDAAAGRVRPPRPGR